MAGGKPPAVSADAERGGAGSGLRRPKGKEGRGAERPRLVQMLEDGALKEALLKTMRAPPLPSMALVAGSPHTAPRQLSALLERGQRELAAEAEASRDLRAELNRDLPATSTPPEKPRAARSRALEGVGGGAEPIGPPPPPRSKKKKKRAAAAAGPVDVASAPSVEEGQQGGAGAAAER